MKPVSLADISYEQGLKLLLLRKQALDEGSVQRMPPAALANTFVMNSTGTQVIKQAAGFLDQLKALPGQAADWAKGTYNAGLDRITTDPGLRNTIGYSLAGAGLGALGAGGLAASRKEKDWKRRLLQGATAGGLLGGGLGFVLNPGSVTDNIASGVEEQTEKLLSTGEPTAEQKRQDVVNAYKDTAGSNPALGATVPAGVGVAGSFLFNKGLGLVPGLHGLDRKALANWMIKNPTDVNWQNFVDPKLFGGTPEQMRLATAAAHGMHKINPALHAELIKTLSHTLPRDLNPTAAELTGYVNSPAAANTAAALAANKGIFSTAPKSVGSWFKPVIGGNVARTGIASIPSIIGAAWSLMQYKKDLAAQQQARDELNWARLNKPAPAANPSFMDLWKDELTKSYPLPNEPFTLETSTRY